MKNLYGITCYSGSQPVHSYVVAGTVAEAARHLGVGVGFVSGTELARDVEIAGVDEQHLEVRPSPTTVLGPFVPHFTETEVEYLESILSLNEIAQLRAKLRPDELGNLRLLRLTAADVEDLKLELQRREPHGVVYRHA